jgi:hypothetical protein
MKKLILISIVLLSALCTTVFSQPDYEAVKNTITNNIIEECHGYIIKHDETVHAYVSTISVPSFYDFELVRADVRNIINSYSDVKILKHWEIENDYFTTWLKAADEILVSIDYYPLNKILMVYVPKKKK